VQHIGFVFKLPQKEDPPHRTWRGDVHVLVCWHYDVAVAVCAVLNSIGCPDKLNYMIAGESLLDDGPGPPWCANAISLFLWKSVF
jgi:hypothetical protein